jgi:thiol-disulfide isomerase/thioredoxin
MRSVSNKVLSMIFLSTVLFSCAKKETKPEVVEDPAPKPLKVYTVNGVSVNAYDFNGLEYFLNKKNDTTYVVNFWATWCVPCVEELPYFEELNEKYKKDKVKVLLVSLDMAKMVESKLLPFIKEKQLKSDVVLLRDPDQNTWLPKVDSTWSGAIPATVIYNKDKRQFYERSFTYKELEKEVSNFK